MHIKSFPLRKLIESEPVVVIENGQIIEQNLKNIRLSLSDLNMELRQKNIFNISDVEFALVETNGKLSVLPKSQKQPLTPQDLGVPTKYIGLTKDLILDRKIMTENLNAVQLDKNWLISELRKQEIDDLKDVFYAGLIQQEVFMFQRKLIQKKNQDNMGWNSIYLSFN